MVRTFSEEEMNVILTDSLKQHVALKEIIELAKSHTSENYNISLIINKAQEAIK